MPAQYLYGINAVLAALAANKRTFFSLLMSEPISEKHRIVSRANQLGVNFQVVPKEKIENLAKGKSHQGVVLKTSEITPEIISSPIKTIKGKKQIWLCLDQIMDPHNLGNILRTAYFFKANGVILPTKNTAPLSPAVAKVSSGALEWVKIHAVADIPVFLSKSRGAGWRVLGAEMGTGISRAKKHDNMLLVFGNEGNGIRDRVKKECDELFWIPGGAETVDSLNVGCSVSVFLYHFSKN